MLSIWEKQSFYYSADIVIAGCGLTGLLTAILIRQRSPETSVRILEKDLYPAGASVKNAGFACFGSISEILDDLEHESEDAAFGRVVERYRGLQTLITLAGKENIDLVPDGGYEIFTGEEKNLLEKSLEALPFINRRLKPELGFEPYSVTGNAFGFHCLEKLIRIEGEASLHSGKLLRALMRTARELGVEINFGCAVQHYERQADWWEIECGEAIFRAAKLIFTTNGYTRQVLPVMDIYPARGQILLTAPLPDLAVKGNFHLHQGYYYFRSFEDGILLGGGRHLDRMSERTFSSGTSPLIQERLEKLLRETILPGRHFEIRDRWSGVMAFGHDNEKEPLVEELQPGLFVAARLGGMGVAMAAQVAQKVSLKALPS